MNICECGCRQECLNKFVRGHNKRKKSTGKTKKRMSFEDMVQELKQLEEEDVDTSLEPAKEEFISKEAYVLTDVPKDVIINYEAGKDWLDKTFINYSVLLRHNEEKIPQEIILSAWVFTDEEQKKKKYTIGKGVTFSNALKEILININ